MIALHASQGSTTYPMNSLAVLLSPILIALASGYFFEKALPDTFTKQIVKVVTPLVWMLLLSLGYKFGQILASAAAVRNAVDTALAFSISTSTLSWLMIAAVSSISGAKTVRNAPVFDAQPASGARLHLIVRPLKDCLIALAMVAAGVTLHLHFSIPISTFHLLPSSNTLLYVLIFVVGTELPYHRIGKQHWSHDVVTVPLLAVIGSLLGGMLTFYALEPTFSLSNAMALSSGFGWFTLSSVLIGDQAGQALGTIALLTDLFRELFAIALISTIGRQFPTACIGASAATALDSTLPFIKQGCGTHYVPLALISGLTLSLTAPALISFFLAQ